MFKSLIKIFNDCAQNPDGKYDFVRVGCMIGCTYLLILVPFILIIIVFFKKDFMEILIQFTESYTMMLGGAGISVGFKNKMEK